MEVFAVIVTLLIPLIAVALLFLFLKPGYEIVPEEERVIIYRLGRFRRIAGPGMVFLLRSLDKIQRRFSIRNEPQDNFVDGLFVYGIPIGLTLNLWYRYDPQKAANRDKAKLRDLALFSESERRNHLAVKLRDSLIRQIGSIEQENPLEATVPIIDKILPILPGVPTCAAMLTRLQQDLTKRLPPLGLFLDMSHPIVITRLHPPEDLIKGFSRDRAAALLRLQFPDLPDSTMVHMLESIEGLEPLRIHEIRQVGNNAGIAAETRWIDEDGQMFRMPLATRSAIPTESAPPTGGAPDQPATEPTYLSQSDLALLKRVPRESTGPRRAA